jgi:GDP-4-dehydro-6-deoxy-D-mannose reductase
MPDVIFHLVGGSVGSAAELERLNVVTTKSVMQALQQVQARPLLVCCGSAAEYGAAMIDGVPVSETAKCAPGSAYGASKLAQTKAALAFAETNGAPVLIARIFNPIGPGMPSSLALAEFARQVATMRASSGILRTGNIHVFRDFIDVEHVVGSLRGLAQNPDARGIVNVCSGEATELSELVRLLINASGRKVALATASERLRPGELRVVVGSTTLLARLGAAPPQTNFADVVARVWHDAETRWARGS